MACRLLARLRLVRSALVALLYLFIKSNPKGKYVMAKLTKPVVTQVVLKDVSISACKLRRSYQGRYGKQFGAVLTGDGVADLGLKAASDGGHWYSTSAEYNGVESSVAEDFVADMDGNPILDDLSDGSKAHMLFNVTEYPAGTRKDGTPYEAGKNVKLVAVRATTFNVKKSAQDALSAMLLGDSMVVAADSPF